MKKFITLTFTALLLTFTMGTACAAVYSSGDVLQTQQMDYKKQQILSMVDSADVQQQLVALGVNSADAKARIGHMTDNELTALNQQMNDMPAGGIVGTIVTVLVVIAVLDVLGITDVYPFIRPINS
ncbi:MAG: Mg2+ and Co2+ transporter CorA [Paraglaciecola sp.]|jgi:Mg2+ and Co2+ transporter CorA